MLSRLGFSRWNISNIPFFFFNSLNSFFCIAWRANGHSNLSPHRAPCDKPRQAWPCPKTPPQQSNNEKRSFFCRWKWQRHRSLSPLREPKRQAGQLSIAGRKPSKERTLWKREATKEITNGYLFLFYFIYYFLLVLFTHSNFRRRFEGVGDMLSCVPDLIPAPLCDLSSGEKELEREMEETFSVLIKDAMWLKVCLSSDCNFLNYHLKA